jgi:hypothetical protein
MRTLWNAADRASLADRIRTLSPGTPAQWGTMDAPRMVAHLAASMGMALGTLPMKMRRTPLRHFPIKQLILYVVPFPKGAPTAPELQRQCVSWDDEMRALHEGLEQFARRDRTGSWPDHPAFGRMSGRAWGVLAYKHIDHHLRQFAV